MGLRLLRPLAVALFIVALPAFLVLTNIRVAANQPAVYDYSVETYEAPAVSGIPAAELKRANRELIDYFNSGDDRFVRIIVKDFSGREVSLFNARETAHLADVKTLFQRVYFVQEATLGYLLAFMALVVVWRREMTMRSFASLLIRASIFTIGAVIAAGVTASMGFDRLWEQFHFLAFANDFWQLNPSRDHLIQMFPEEFWFEISATIALATIVEALIILSISVAYRYATRDEPKADDSVEREANSKRKERWERLDAPPHPRRLWRFGSRG